MTELWCLHIYGPDDVIAAPSKDEAEAKAVELRRFLAAFAAKEQHEDDPKITVEVEPWPYSAEAHAAELPKWAPPDRLDA